MKKRNAQFLVDYILNLYDQEQLMANPNLMQHLSNLLNQFIHGNLNYHEISNFSRSILSNSTPIEKLQEILTISDFPIEFKPLNNEYLSRKSFRNWTSSEDTRLLAGMLKYGSESWTSISKFVGNNRTRSQCSQRWNRGLNPRISKESWTPDEDRFLISLVQRYGEKSWTRVSASMSSRSDVQCRYRYYQITRPPTVKNPAELINFPTFPQIKVIKKKKVFSPRVFQPPSLPPPPVFPPPVFSQPLLPPPPPLPPSIPPLNYSQYNPTLYSVF